MRPPLSARPIKLFPSPFVVSEEEAYCTNELIRNRNGSGGRLRHGDGRRAGDGPHHGVEDAGEGPRGGGGAAARRGGGGLPQGQVEAEETKPERLRHHFAVKCHIFPAANPRRSKGTLPLVSHLTKLQLFMRVWCECIDVCATELQGRFGC